MGASSQLNNFNYLEIPDCLRETGTGGSNPLTPTIHSFKRSCRIVPAKSRQVLSDVRLLPIVAKPQVLEHCLGSAVPDSYVSQYPFSAADSTGRCNTSRHSLGGSMKLDDVAVGISHKEKHRPVG